MPTVVQPLNRRMVVPRGWLQTISEEEDKRGGQVEEEEGRERIVGWKGASLSAVQRAVPIVMAEDPGHVKGLSGPLAMMMGTSP